MLVREILAIKGKVLYTIAPERRLGEAVVIMTEQDVGSLVVFHHGRMAGILTFREVLRAVHKAGADWASTPCTSAKPILGRSSYGTRNGSRKRAASS